MTREEVWMQFALKSMDPVHADRMVEEWANRFQESRDYPYVIIRNGLPVNVRIAPNFYITSDTTRFNVEDCMGGTFVATRGELRL